jgi:diacylglycerol O-acyltransferase-1
MIPICQEAFEPIRDQDYFQVFILTLKIGVPAAYMWLLNFYAIFHAYFNFLAEITGFGDRRFYSDWWNAGNLSEYWRKWNYPIHYFLIRHVYYPLRRRNVDKTYGLWATFLVSAIAHEYVVIGVFRVFNLIAFTMMLINVPIMIIQTKLTNVVSPNMNN